MLQKQQVKHQISTELIRQYYESIVNNTIRKEAIKKIAIKTGLKEKSIQTYLKTGNFRVKHREIVLKTLDKFLSEQNKILQYD